MTGRGRKRGGEGLEGGLQEGSGAARASWNQRGAGVKAQVGSSSLLEAGCPAAMADRATVLRALRPLGRAGPYGVRAPISFRVEALVT